MEFNGCHVIAARSTHAVQAAMFVLELAAEIPPETIQEALNYYESSKELKEFFPVKTEGRGMHINDQENSVNIKQPKGTLGIILQKNSDKGVPEYVFNMENNQISFTCNKYTRWDEISSSAIEILSQMSKFVLPTPGVIVIALQYVDEFFVTGDKNEFRSSIIFDAKSERIPTAALSEKNFWHNHAGWFVKSPKNDRILNNLNISYYPQNPEKNAVQIISAHKEILNAPLTEHDNFANFMLESFEMLHKMNKEMFKEILNEETLKSINLN
jgi:uncharacterized protein (TIGR04255 family)